MTGTAAGARKGWETRRQRDSAPKRVNARTKKEKKSPQVALRAEMKRLQERAFKLSLELTRMEWHGPGYAQKAKAFRRTDDTYRAAKERYERSITETEQRYARIKRRAQQRRDESVS